jgi:hypothetical protein
VLPGNKLVSFANFKINCFIKNRNEDDLSMTKFNEYMQGINLSSEPEILKNFDAAQDQEFPLVDWDMILSLTTLILDYTYSNNVPEFKKLVAAIKSAYTTLI